MASLNNTSIEPLMISSSENIGNTSGVNSTKIKYKVINWKKIVTWCFITISFMILLLTTAMVFVMYSKTDSHLEENQVANQNFLKVFKQFNSTLFNIQRSQTKLERKIKKNNKEFNQDNFDKFNQSLSDIQFDKEKTETERRDEMASDLSVLNSSQPQIEKKVKDNNTTISWKTFLAKTFLTLG